MSKEKAAGKFPLFQHATGQWAKKIAGKTRYFGRDKDAALKLYVETRDALEAGREPKAYHNGEYTVAEVGDLFLKMKLERVESGELSKAMYVEYCRMAKHVSAVLGKRRHASDLHPEDFGKLRNEATKRLGPTSLGKFITCVMSLFKFAYDSELIDRPIKYGGRFDRPSKKSVRQVRAGRADKMADPVELWKVIDAADPQLRAQILLGLNVGYGATDCAGLQRVSLTARRGWLECARQKTWVDRKASLWPETLAALDDVAKIRPAAADPADAGCVFLTSQGNRWVRYYEPGGGRHGFYIDALATAYRKLIGKVKANVPGGFYCLRHNHRTISDECGDQRACDLIMGHAPTTGMSQHYVERIGDDRLERVASHVREWLLRGKSPAAAPEAPVEAANDVLPFRAAMVG
jgi:hypothetical protein